MCHHKKYTHTHTHTHTHTCAFVNTHFSLPTSDYTRSTHYILTTYDIHSGSDFSYQWFRLFSPLYTWILHIRSVLNFRCQSDFWHTETLVWMATLHTLPAHRLFSRMRIIFQNGCLHVNRRENYIIVTVQKVNLLL